MTDELEKEAVSKWDKELDKRAAEYAALEWYSERFLKEWDASKTDYMAGALAERQRVWREIELEFTLPPSAYIMREIKRILRIGEGE